MTEEDDSTHHTARSPERVGYRLGFEAAKELIANELETVRSYQGRSIVLLSVTALVAGIGIRGSGGADFASATTGGLLAGWLILAVGLLSSLVGAVCLNRPLKGAFDPLPKPFVTRFGDDEANQYPTNDDAYRAMALEG
ncbi:MAG: hypothetical protein OXI33_10395, partial [Chloroflexota bacterium]|nr:hypothetical protein [Chloroflexota bacterium]